MPIRVKMPHCCKSHVAAHILKTEEMKYSVTDPTRECYCHQRDQIIKIEKRYCKRRKFNKNKNKSLFNSYNNKYSI